MDTSSIAFWGILGGMSLVCVAIVIVVYFMCFSRNKYCMSSENEDLLETTVHHEEVHTVTSETRTSTSGKSEPEVVHRTEHTHRVTTKQRSRGNLFQAQTSHPVTKICVSPRTEASNAPLSEGNNACDLNGRHFEDRPTFTLSRPGDSQMTSIGTTP